MERGKGQPQKSTESGEKCLSQGTLIRTPQNEDAWDEMQIYLRVSLVSVSLRPCLKLLPETNVLARCQVQLQAMPCDCLWVGLKDHTQDFGQELDFSVSRNTLQYTTYTAFCYIVLTVNKQNTRITFITNYVFSPREKLKPTL